MTSDATNKDNRNIESMTEYQEDRIAALKQRIKDLEEENAHLIQKIESMTGEKNGSDVD